MSSNDECHSHLTAFAKSIKVLHQISDLDCSAFFNPEICVRVTLSPESFILLNPLEDILVVLFLFRLWDIVKGLHLTVAHDGQPG